jgi:hypothetical protein
LVAPVALCKNISVALNATGSVSITAAQVNNGSTDACGIQSTTVSPSVFNCTNTGTNTVTLTVKDVNGNISTCTSVVTVTGGPLYNYVILASKEAELENRSYVYSGGVGVTTSSGRADIEQYSTVTAAGTFVQSTHTYVSSGSSVTTQINSVAVAPIPTFETNPFNSNNNITVGNGQTVTLTDSIYNMIKIGKYGTVVFTQPVVNIRHIESQEYAAIRFTQCTKLRVKEHLHLKKNSLFNPDGLAVTVFAQKHVHVMDGCKVTGTVYAKDEDIKVWGKSNNRSVMTGLFIGEEVESEGYTDWYANTQCGRCSLGSGLFARISNSVDVSCSGATNGSATVAVTGGTAPYTYQWNNSTLQTTPTATGLGVGNYTVTVTDATGATTTATENITVFNYTILATDRIYIDRNDTVFGGSVGITSTSGRIDMDRYSGVIDDNSIVIAPYQTLDATNYINEQVFGIAPATTIPYQGNITYSSSSDLSVANNATVTLTATDTLRRNITIGDNATLIITGGKLNVTGNMTLNRNSKVRFTSCTNVRIKGNFYSNDNPNINPDGAGVTFFINGSSVNIDNSAKVNATIYAPNATIGISNGTASAPNIITGKLIGKTVDVGDYTYLYADDDCPCVPGTGAVTPDIIKPIISCPPNKTINVNATSDGNHHGWYYHNHDNGWHYGWYFHHHGWYYDNNDHSWHNGWYDDDDDCESASSVSLGVPVTSDNVGVATVTNNHPSSVYPVGTTVVIWTVTDFAGNSATCSQTVTVNCIGGHHLTNPTTVTPSASSVTAPTQTPAPAAVQSAERVGNVTSNAYPNPFKTNATIAFTVSESTDNVTLKVYNLEGTEIKQLYDGPAEGNVEYKFQLDADKSMDAGIYFYRVETKEGKAAVNKLILLK